MDIHNWLQTTADRQPPDDEDDHQGFPAFLKPPRQPEPKQREYHRTRKRTSSEPPPSEHHHHRRRKRHKAATRSSSSSPDHARQLQPAEARSRSSSHASHDRHVRESARKEVPRQSFERRARHKTRPDRYDAKPKQRNEGRKTHKERKSKTKDRKSHQSADVAKATGLIQSFQLKNGRKDKRLTLRPDANAGIFKHGRSSGPVAANGQGLPDLVFNEMKFLQRPREHQDEVPIDSAAQNQSKKSKKQLREEEISAYFVKKPTLEAATIGTERDRPGTKAAKYGAIQSREEQQLPTSEVDARLVRNSVDLPERPFLGFGSKGPSHETNTHHPTSYLPWSESVATRPQPSLRRETHLPGNDQAMPGNTSSERARSISQKPTPNRKSHTMKKSRNADIKNTQPGGRWIESNRTRGRAHVERYAPESIALPTTKRTKVDSVSSSSSESLPGPPADHDDEVSLKFGRRKQTRDICTSDVLKIRQEDRAEETLQPTQPQQQGPDDGHSRSTTPTSDVLRQALHAVTTSTLHRPSNQDVANVTKQLKREGRHEPRYINILDTGYRPASHAQKATPRSNAASVSDRVTMPSRGFSRTADTYVAPQERRPLQPMAASTVNSGPRWRPPSRDACSFSKPHPAREEAPYDLQDAANLPTYNPYAYTDHMPYEDPGEGMAYEQEQSYVDPAARQSVTYAGRFEADYVPQQSFESLDDGLHDGEFFNPSTDRLSAQPRPGVEDDVQETDDGLNGFWRPNVLY
ncbi:hypothetical protein PRZ48_009215 [Zasmidium cellare]|uniref:Uncharacterized protein n=1 Tax=Zasmidium cellare TaxID=395010 RepID=A0ABR0EC32_ZASCE|nr:hypothetical protein PRZ48_009215 [Zasmidium cellare]